MRNALLLANLTCPTAKIEDGFTRFLKPNDVSKIASKGAAAKAEMCEATLRDASIMAEWLKKSGKVTSDDMLGPMGRVCVRVGLYATDKMKYGREGKQVSMEDIRNAFLADLSGIAKQPVEYDAWKKPDDAEQKPGGEGGSGEPSAKKAKMASVADHHNPEWVAKDQGLLIGTHVCEKKPDGGAVNPENVYKITSIGQEVKMDVACNFSSTFPCPRTTVSLEDLVQNWGVFKSDASFWLHDGEHRPQGTIPIDVTKCRLFTAMQSVDTPWQQLS